MRSYYLGSRRTRATSPRRWWREGAQPRETLNRTPHPGHRAGPVVRRWAWKAYVRQRAGIGGCGSRHSLHHITPQLLVDSFYSLQKNAAAGVDGVTWREYEKILPQRVAEMHRMIHTGAYRATPSRRVYIPKADGRQRPLGIASIEDKIVQQAVVTVLSAIYEVDFLGFSYGFRPGRGQHDALDALTAGIKSRKVNWIVDADIRSFFDEIDHGWMLRFLEHRIADQRIIRLIRKWLEAGVIEDGKRIPAQRGTPQGAVIFAVAGEHLPALRLRSLGSALAETARARRGYRASLCRRQCGGL